MYRFPDLQAVSTGCIRMDREIVFEGFLARKGRERGAVERIRLSPDHYYLILQVKGKFKGTAGISIPEIASGIVKYMRSSMISVVFYQIGDRGSGRDCYCYRR